MSCPILPNRIGFTFLSPLRYNNSISDIWSDIKLNNPNPNQRRNSPNNGLPVESAKSPKMIATTVKPNPRRKHRPVMAMIMTLSSVFILSPLLIPRSPLRVSVRPLLAFHFQAPPTSYQGNH